MAMFKPVCCESLSAITIQKLRSNGYNYVSDLNISRAPWVKDISLNIQIDEQSFQVKSALEIYKEEIENCRIKTGCASLDECLDGGLPLGRVIEVCGAPAQGKTQLCLQLCILVQLPLSLGGLDGEAMYIDTGANFTANRLKEISAYYEELYSSELTNGWNREISLQRVHYIQALGTSQFLAAVYLLKKFVKDNQHIKLIVIDDIATPFKDGCSENDRIGILYQLMASLNNIASTNNIAVVIVNEVNLRLGLEECQVGALGDSWAHLTERLLLAPPLLAMRHQCGPSAIQICKQGLSDNRET